MCGLNPGTRSAGGDAQASGPPTHVPVTHPSCHPGVLRRRIPTGPEPAPATAALSLVGSLPPRRCASQLPESSHQPLPPALGTDAGSSRSPDTCRPDGRVPAGLHLEGRQRGISEWERGTCERRHRGDGRQGSEDGDRQLGQGCCALGSGSRASRARRNS